MTTALSSSNSDSDNNKDNNYKTIVIGGGRIGSLIANNNGNNNDDDDTLLLGRNDPIATSIDEDGEGPIFIATRNDVLDSLVEGCPERRKKDLVFLQNG